MATACIQQLTFKGQGFAKPVATAFDVAHASTDGGAVLLKALDAQLGVTATVAECLDRPGAQKVTLRDSTLRSCLGFEGHPVALAFKRFEGAALGALGVPAIVDRQVLLAQGDDQRAGGILLRLHLRPARRIGEEVAALAVAEGVAQHPKGPGGVPEASGGFR